MCITSEMKRVTAARRRRILEVDKRHKRRRRQSRRYRNKKKYKQANESGSINQCFSATAIANIKKNVKSRKKVILFYRPERYKNICTFNKCSVKRENVGKSAG
jgi:uncharacterized protein (UPF0218 family)